MLWQKLGKKVHSHVKKQNKKKQGKHSNSRVKIWSGHAKLTVAPWTFVRCYGFNPDHFDASTKN